MKTWVKYTLIGATALVSNVAAGVVVLLITGDWPPSGTSWPFLLAGYATAAAWYFVFMHGEYVQNAIAVEAPKRGPAPASESYDQIIEAIATGIALVYENEPNDMYREKAKTVYSSIVGSVYDILDAEMEAERRVVEEGSSFLQKLEAERDSILHTFSNHVRNNFPLLAKEQMEALKNLNKLIEAHKNKARKNRG